MKHRYIKPTFCKVSVRSIMWTFSLLILITTLGASPLMAITEAEKKDRIVEVLFKLNRGQANTLNRGQANTLTNHDYNDFGDQKDWDGIVLGYQGGHAGWDVQTISVAGNVPTVDEKFYSLTSGTVINTTASNTIAVYDETNHKTTLYLHARQIFVSIGDDVEVGDLLGIQGNTGLNVTGPNDSEHVHIEVRNGRANLASFGAGATIPPRSIDPIDYLYSQVIMLADADAPDLIVSDIGIDEGNTLTAGQDITLRVTVTNEGTSESDRTTLRYFLLSDSDNPADATVLGKDNVSRLNPNETDDTKETFTAPNQSGTYYYGACVVSVDNESDTENNCLIVPSAIEVIGAVPPDLIVSDLTIDEGNTLTAGQDITLRATVLNQGAGESDRTMLRYYLSSDRAISTDDTEVGTDRVKSLTRNETDDEDIDLATPNQPGTYFYGACVDSVNNESDTGNNCLAVAQPIEVIAPPPQDLIVSDLTIDEGNTLTAGQDITLRATVRNGGTGESDSTTLRYYLSSDGTISTDDTEVGTDSVQPLTHNETNDEDIDLAAPNQPGTYYYGACVDGVVNESDAANNCFVFSVTVQGQDIEQPSTTLLKNSGASVAVGDSISLSITVEEVTDLAGWEFDINFNPAILSAVSVDEGDFLNEGNAGNTLFVEGKIDNVTGTINGFRVARLTTGGVTGSGELLSITFEAEEAGDGELQMRNVELASANAMNIPFEIKYNSVTVHERAIAWDVNGDGQVNILDLVLVAQNLGQSNAQADINGDGEVNILDLVAIAQNLEQ